MTPQSLPHLKVPAQRGRAGPTGRPWVAACRADFWNQATHTRPLTHRDLGARDRPHLSVANSMVSFLKRTRGGSGCSDIGWVSGLLPRVMAWKVPAARGQHPVSFPPFPQQDICGVPTPC